MVVRSSHLAPAVRVGVAAVLCMVTRRHRGAGPRAAPAAPHAVRLVFVESLLKWACNQTHRSVAEYSISPELLGKREAGNTAVSRHREEQVL